MLDTYNLEINVAFVYIQLERMLLNEVSLKYIAKETSTVSLYQKTQKVLYSLHKNNLMDYFYVVSTKLLVSLFLFFSFQIKY